MLVKKVYAITFKISIIPTFTISEILMFMQVNGTELFMIESLKKIILNFKSAEFLKFIIVGFINTLNSIVISYFISAFVKIDFFIDVPFVCGYICSLLIGYVLNCFFTFKSKSSVKTFFKYIVSYIPNFLIQVFFVSIMAEILNITDGLPRLILYAISAVVGLLITFLCLKLFAFKTVGKDECDE